MYHQYLFKSICLLLLLPLESLSLANDFFTSTALLKNLFATEKRMIKAFDQYLEIENHRLNRLQQLINQYKLSTFNGNDKDVELYLTHPINAYLLIKRLTADKDRLDELIINESRSSSELIEMTLKNLSWPYRDDLSGAGQAILRLQETYQLDAKMLAKGIIIVGDKKVIQNYQHQTLMKADDCFELAQNAFDRQQFDLSIVWLEETIEQLTNDNDDDFNQTLVKRTKIFEYLTIAYYQQGNVRMALESTRRLIKLEPKHPAIKNVTRFEKELTDAEEKHNSTLNNDFRKTSNETDESMSHVMKQFLYPLCRGENRLPPNVESQLKCYFLNTTRKPFLRLTRVKVEEAYKIPHLVMFHEFLSENEINLIKSLAEPKLKRSEVLNEVYTQIAKTNLSDNRISQSVYLQNDEHPLLQTISKRIQAITGLDMTTAENLQVANYGIGGHFTPHFDYLGFRDNFENEESYKKRYPFGNRVATWMNYMSDVTAGGATVFPYLGVSVWPQKGSAVFWYNLLRSGAGDEMTGHSACPVLVGSKWVSNKWIKESGQEFRYPCTRDPEEYHVLQVT